MSIQKVIRGEEGEAFSRWEPADVQAPAEPAQAPVTVAEIEAVQQAAYEEAYARGLAEGREQGQREGFAAGQKEAAELASRIGRVLQSLAAPLEELDDEVEAQLVRLALTLAKQIIRREIQAQPGEILAVVREAVALLPLASREVKVHLHPDDARFLREQLGPQDQSAWQMVEDVSISRGGCRVTTLSSQIDATLERRLAALAAELLGGARSADAEGEA